MEAVILFPAIDLKNGQCVRLEQGDMARATVFNLDPAAQARAFAAQGFEYLHVVDLDGAFAGKPMNAAAVEAMLKAVTMPVQLGGGIRDLATIEAWLTKGIARVIIGTAAVRDPELVKNAARKFPGRVAVGLDARDAFGQPGLDRLQITNPAAELHRHGDRLEHRLHRERIHRLAGKGAVEIDHVQIFEPLRGEARRLRRGIEVEHGRARHVTLFKAHALAVLQVDGGEKDHGFHFKKLEIKARPKRWLFSG